MIVCMGVVDWSLAVWYLLEMELPLEDISNNSEHLAELLPQVVFCMWL